MPRPVDLKQTALHLPPNVVHFPPRHANKVKGVWWFFPLEMSIYDLNAFRNTFSGFVIRITKSRRSELKTY